MMQILPSGKPAGAEITGLDLDVEFDEESFDRLRAAIYQYGMVYLRDQRITRPRHIEISRLLGAVRGTPSGMVKSSDIVVNRFPEIMRLSNIRKDGEFVGRYDAGHSWHSDNCFRAEPNSHALLYAIEIPHDDDGEPLGSTMFVNTHHAYETLPAALKQSIRNLSAVHSFINPYWDVKEGLKKNSSQEMSYSNETRYPKVTHPVVRAHPHTGVPCLFVNERYTMLINGLSEIEGRALIDKLCAHIAREEVRYVHKWAVGDLVIWDDCMVQHFALADYPLTRRRMIERTTVLGTAPIAAFQKQVNEAASVR